MRIFLILHTAVFFLKQLKQARLAADQLCQFYLSAIRPILDRSLIITVVVPTHWAIADFLLADAAEKSVTKPIHHRHTAHHDRCLVGDNMVSLSSAETPTANTPSDVVIRFHRVTCFRDNPIRAGVTGRHKLQCEGRTGQSFCPDEKLPTVTMGHPMGCCRCSNH